MLLWHLNSIVLTMQAGSSKKMSDFTTPKNCYLKIKQRNIKKRVSLFENYHLFIIVIIKVVVVIVIVTRLNPSFFSMLREISLC